MVFFPTILTMQRRQRNAGYQSAVLQADFPKVNNTLTAVPDLTIPNLIAGHWYRVTGMLFWTAGAGAAHADLNGGTATMTGIRGFRYGAGDGYESGGISALTSELLSSTEDGTSLFEITLQVDVGGTLIPRFAQQNTDAAEAVLQTYATITAQDVTPLS